MMKNIPCWFLLVLTCTSLIQAEDDVHLVFTSFRDNGQDGLHLYYSHDAMNWQQPNKDRSFLTPTVGEDKLMRDPCIIQDEKGTFHMVWSASWKSKYIGYASSKDLIHWSDQKQIDVMTHEPTAKNSWAPELFYDPPSKKFLILWASTVPGPDRDETGFSKIRHGGHRMYYTTTTDFESFTPTRLFFDPGHSVIDATMIKSGDRYYLIYKDETEAPNPEKNLKLATSDSPLGPWKYDNKPFTESWVEGPSILKWKDQFIVYYDEYTRHRYGASSTTDWKNWKFIGDQLHFPKGHRHGTVLKVDPEIAEKLLRFSEK